VGVTQGGVIRGCRCVTTTCVVEDLASNALHSIAAIGDFDNLPVVTCETITGLASSQPKSCLMMCSFIQLHPELVTIVCTIENKMRQTSLTCVT